MLNNQNKQTHNIWPFQNFNTSHDLDICILKFIFTENSVSPKLVWLQVIHSSELHDMI